MATSPMNGVIQRLRMVLRDSAGRTDGQLLEDYISRRDQAAVAALVRRHGPMVWDVCRRVLRNHHDAEDAFQATFLVLVRKAASIASRELVANWLYGVAHQTALKARATAAKRKERERQVTEMPEPAVTQQDPWRDLQPLLDEELSRLPAMTDGEGKPVPQPRVSAEGAHIPKEVTLAPGKEIELYELKLELKPASESDNKGFSTLYGTGKFQIQYERIFGNSSVGTITLGPTLSKLATGKLELEVKEADTAPEKKH
jgi:RNA polymerase sigma factor (sigma-70 family)